MDTRAELLYLKKLKIMLSFFFDEDDINSIAYDYTERFQMAALDGNAPGKLPDSLKSPWQECRQIVAETYPSPVKAFLSQKKCRLFLMLLVFVLTTFCLSVWCEKRFVNFYVPALCINLGAFAAGMLFDRDLPETAPDFRVFHVFLLGCMCMEILVVGFCLPHMGIVHVGKFYVGEFAAGAVFAIMLILFIMNIVMLVMSNAMHGLLLLTRHVMTVVLASVYLVSQLHIMQESISVFLIYAITGVLCIYFESIILEILRIIINHFWNRNLWTHS